jgi:uncharacterized protein
VILVDANLLLYARVSDFPQHARARRWLEDRLSGSTRVGLPWASLLAFVRLISNPRVFNRPSSVTDAWAQVEEWLDTTPAWIPAPTDRHREVMKALIPAVTTAKHVPDAHLAALAIEHGLLLASSDSDFARFPGLQWENPLNPN